MTVGKRALSAAQADEVGKRLNPREGQEIVFARSGGVLHTPAEREAELDQHGVVYVAGRVGGLVEVRRSTV